MSYQAQNLGPTVLATAFALTGLSTVVVSLRFYCRAVVMGSVKFFDYLMGVALLVTWGIAVINYYQVKYGTGTHMYDQPHEDPEVGLEMLEGTLKSWYVYQLVYLVDLCLVKFSILCFYRAISSARMYRICIYIVMFLVGAFTISMLFVNAFECAKPSDAWSVEILFQGAGTCNDLHPVYFGQAGFNIASDIVILVLPMPILSTLQMKARKRLAMITVFSVGAIAVLASIVRIYALFLWSTDPDVPYQGATILIWSQIEINVAITSASIPALKPLFSECFYGPSTTAPGSSGYIRYGGGYGRSGTSNNKSTVRVISRPIASRMSAADFDLERSGNRSLALTPISPQAPGAPPPAYSAVSSISSPSNPHLPNGSAYGWSKSGPGVSGAIHSDEHALMRHSEESQDRNAMTRPSSQDLNMVITRKVSVDMRSDYGPRPNQANGFAGSTVKSGWHDQ